MADWQSERRARDERLAVGSKFAAGRMVAPKDATALLEAVIRPGDRICLEGDNQKQADFLAGCLAKADPKVLHDLHVVQSGIDGAAHQLPAVSISAAATAMPIEVSDRTDVRLRRLMFRSRHRGTQESDLILGSFAETYLPAFESAQIEKFEALLECPDAELFDWMIAGRTPPPEHDHDVMRLLRQYCAEARQIPQPN
jgi:succinate dehydrogenase flavin-adding protein (antitoxin of CptAB toxin-antitoxin module)